MPELETPPREPRDEIEALLNPLTALIARPDVPATVHILALSKIARLLAEPKVSGLLRELLRKPAAIPVFVSELYNALRECVCGSNAQVRERSAEVLGLLGALDPSKLQEASSTHERVMLDPIGLAAHIIEEYLVPALRRAATDSAQDRAAYALQEILRACKCDATTPLVELAPEAPDEECAM